MKQSILLFIILSVGTSLQTHAQKEGQDIIDSLQTAMKNYNATRTELNKTGYDITDSNLVNILNSLSWELKNTGDYVKAKQDADDALVISQKINFKKGTVKAYNIIGNIYMEKGNYPDALKNHIASLKSSKEIGDKKGIATSNYNIGIIYYKQGNYPDALKNYLNSLKYFEEIGFKKGIAASYSVLGIINQAQGNYLDGLKNHFASLKINEEIGDKNGIANTYTNIGIIYSKQDHYPDALNFFFISLKIREEIGDKKGVADSYGNIATIYFEQGNYLDAFKNDFAALKIREEIGDKQGITVSFNNLGEANIKLKKYTEAKKYLDKGLSLSTEIGSKDDIKTSYGHLAVLDSTIATSPLTTQLQKGEHWKNAYLHHKLFILYRDSLINEESTKKQTQTEMQYEFDKKEITTKANQEKKDAVQQAELQKQKVIRNSFIGGAALLLLLLFGMVNRYRFKQKANKELVVAYDNLKATQQQLVQSEKMAAFGVMAARVAHEIQNPLNFVTNFSELSKELAHDIAQAKTDEEKKEAVNTLTANLEKINHHSKRADTIIKQLQEHTRAGTANEFFEKDKRN
ncbi:MAG: tetratricopeptide repeat protein [Bacteroidia bacterium]